MTTGSHRDCNDDFDMAPFGYLILSPDGNIMRVNDTFCRYLDEPPQGLLSRRFRDILTIPGRIFFETHLAPLLVLQSSCSEIAFDFITRSGGRLPTLANIFADRDAGGKVTFLRVGVFEATDRRNFELELLEARRAVENKNLQLETVNLTLAESNASLDRANIQLKELYAQMSAARASAEAANRVKTTFLAHMSHEIRTPLNGVLGMASVLHEALSNPDDKKMAAVICESGEILLSIINDILDLSKLEAGKIDLEAIPFSPADIARKISDLYSLRTAEKSVGFRMQFDMDAHDIRCGDPVRIMQIMHNLVGNAVKFTEKGAVTVVIRELSTGSVKLEVRDTGIGMTQNQADLVFEAFTQADNSTTRKYGGTGLGMSIVRQLVAAMEGTILIESALGQGTCVHVTLPLPRVVQSADLTPALAEDVRHDLFGLRVLVAEDNKTNRFILGAMLKNLGVLSTFVVDGQQAVDAYDPERYDMLLLDISMPTMDGPTALALIHQQEAERSRAMIPTVAFTANALKHQIDEYLAMGFDTHLAKPISKLDILKTLGALLDGKPSSLSQRA
ncbi:MAG: response regulator [Rhodobacterales bacterium]|nr:response regulator [Rhodobacterales bacterium]